jgi:peroxiredoxin
MAMPKRPAGRHLPAGRGLSEPMKRKTIRRVGLLMAVLVVLVVVLRMSGEAAPEVEFATIKGERIKLRDLRGHPVLVAFWASDCRACLEEMPDLAALYRDYSARGFQLIAVAMPYDPPNRVLAMAEARQLPYKVALDPLGALTQAFGGVQLVPDSFLIGPDGRIALHRLGRLRAEDLRPRLERLLGES